MNLLPNNIYQATTLSFYITIILLIIGNTDYIYNYLPLSTIIMIGGTSLYTYEWTKPMSALSTINLLHHILPFVALYTVFKLKNKKPIPNYNGKQYKIALIGFIAYSVYLLLLRTHIWNVFGTKQANIMIVSIIIILTIFFK